MSLRQKIENHFRNRSGQGSLVGVIVATVMFSMIVAAGTEWYLSMNKSTGRMQEQMAAQSYAYNEWQNVLAEDYDSLSSKTRKNVSDKFDLKRDVGAEKIISGSGKEKDVVITVYRKGTDQVAYAMHSGKARPTMDNYYTKAQADAMVDKKLKELIRLENEDKNVKLPEGKALYAYLNGQKLPLSSQGNSDPVEKPYIIKSFTSDTYTYRIYSDGWCEQFGIETTTTNAMNHTVTLMIPYKSDKYFATFQHQRISAGWWGESADMGWLQLYNKTNSSFSFAFRTDISTYVAWATFGIVSESIVNQYK